MRWIRLDVAFDDCEWLSDLEPAVQLAWIKLLCHMKRDGVKGKCKALPLRIAAKKWGVTAADVDALLTAGIAGDAIAVDGETWEVIGWSKYQADSDETAKERMQRKRDRDKAGHAVTEGVTPEPPVTHAVTECYAVTPVTPVDYGEKTVTCRVTETETEKLRITQERDLGERGGVGEREGAALSQSPEQSSTHPWWESEPDALEGQVVSIIRSAKPYRDFAVPRKAVEKALAGWRKVVPDDQSILDKLTSFRDRALAKANRKPEYVDPLGTISVWIRGDEARYTRIKNAREIDAERAARKAPVPSATPGSNEPRIGIDYEFREMPCRDGEIVWLEPGEEWPPDCVPAQVRFIPGSDEQFSEPKWRAERERGAA